MSTISVEITEKDTTLEINESSGVVEVVGGTTVEALTTSTEVIEVQVAGPQGAPGAGGISTVDASNHGTGYLPDAHHNRIHSDSDHSGPNKVAVSSAGVINATRATIDLVPNATIKDDSTALAARLYLLQDYDMPTGASHQSHPRGDHGTTVAPTAGKIRCHRIYLPKGDVITSLTFVLAAPTTFGGTGQLFAFVLTDANRVVRAATADMSASGAAQGAKTGTLTSPYTVPADGWYYAGVLIQQGSTGSAPGAIAARTVPLVLQKLAPVTGFEDTTDRTTIPATDGTVTLAAGDIGSGFYFYTSP